MKKLITRRGLIRSAGIFAPALLLRPSQAQFNACLPGFCVRNNAPCDPYWSNTVLLTPFDGANGATGAPGYNDFSPAAHGTATNVGTASIDTSQSLFGGSSFKPGTGGMLFPDSADWTLSSANSDQFTIECAFRVTATAVARIFVCQSFTAVGTSSWIFQTDNTSASELQFLATSLGASFNVNIISSGAGLVANTWYQIAVDKDATGKIRIYVNGVMVGSGTPANSAIQNTSRQLGIGCNDNSTGSFNAGWIDELRITKGVARYASDGGYTPATAAFPLGAC